jgi:hypothetical protein
VWKGQQPAAATDVTVLLSLDMASRPHMQVRESSAARLAVVLIIVDEQRVDQPMPVLLW